MANTLTREDCRFILTSLDFTRQAFEETEYPTYEGRVSRLTDVAEVADKVRAIRDALPQDGTENA